MVQLVELVGLEEGVTQQGKVESNPELQDEGFQHKQGMEVEGCFDQINFPYPLHCYRYSSFLGSPDC